MGVLVRSWGGNFLILQAVETASKTALEAAACRPPCVALAAHAPAALALSHDTVFLHGSTFLCYDSNIFKIANGLTLPASLGGPDQGDMYYGLGAGIRLDLPIGRQRITADAYYNSYWYTRFHDLDYDGYGAKAAWDWRAGNDWHGTIGGGMNVGVNGVYQIARVVQLNGGLGY